jgi:hypothetical protein
MELGKWRQNVKQEGEVLDWNDSTFAIDKAWCFVSFRVPFTPTINDVLFYTCFELAQTPSPRPEHNYRLIFLLALDDHRDRRRGWVGWWKHWNILGAAAYLKHRYSLPEAFNFKATPRSSAGYDGYHRPWRYILAIQPQPVLPRAKPSTLSFSFMQISIPL